MSSDFNILVSADYYDQFLERLQELGEPHYNWQRISWPERDDRLPALLTNVDAIISRQDLQEEDYQAANRLKLLQVPTAGFDHINLQKARDYGLIVSNNGGANAISVAEHVFMLILCIYRRLLFHYNAVVKGPWVNLKYENLELYGKQIGIVGLGNVGKQVAIRANCLGMEVFYYDIVRPDPEFERKHSLAFMDFEGLLSSSDIVTFHVPLTELTEDMINSKTLGLMKQNSVLINTSRGKVQDEQALYEALASGKLKGAGIDVFKTEPLPGDSKFLLLDNVVLTPHNGPSKETQDRVVKTMVNNIRRVEQGLVPKHIVNNL